jgi:hypothetical protein
VTGRGHIDINRISGYLPGKIVFYLMQVGWVGMDVRACTRGRECCILCARCWVGKSFYGIEKQY